VSVRSLFKLESTPIGGVEPKFAERYGWRLDPMTKRTLLSPIIFLTGLVNYPNRRKTSRKMYRNPVIYAQELQDELVNNNLTRKELAERHGVSSARIAQWLSLLKMSGEKKLEIEALGDQWSRQLVTERQLRRSIKHST